nr:WhiB family transcriptional regulator [Mycolicibacterium sp. GF69]
MDTREAGRARPARRPCAEELEWQLHAKCRGLPTEMFFASDGERGERRAAREERAKKVCRSCPVQRECLRYALTSVEAWGVWGAMTPRERERVGGPCPPGLRPIPASRQARRQ